jgi:pimeloyl-ACP methyl ester carboxylesterase
MTLGDLADEAIASVEGPVHLAGVAMGGIVAQHILVRHPRRVRSALLACCGGRTRPDVQMARAEACEMAGMEAVIDSTLERWFTPAAMAEARHPGVAYARATLTAMDPLAMADAWRALAWHDLIDQLGTVRVPVTVVAGLDDAAVSVASAKQLQGRLMRSRIRTTPGPHMIHLEEPARLRALLDEHLAWAEDGGPANPVH